MAFVNDWCGHDRNDASEALDWLAFAEEVSS
jgi:hypothetical protein